VDAARGTLLSVIDSEHAARIQLLYRQVNDRIHSVGSDVFRIPSDEPLALVCECLDLGCVERIHIPAEDLKRARSSPAHFVVLPGHEAEGYETVLERNQRFVIVTKDEAVVERLRAAAAAADEDTRPEAGLQ
jgi:hypothetical protein